ncbi:uncharacterized protein HMPREF1541_08679 [Cyphellophora europaea CBS 101466]|uniref:Velvet domain-containing protein n=1 Tax=Cyphellophora europaea (strain CBS 101466) TaxID=1220924 RepID=W2RIU9_CYPE1|nr:uncharacterized protein HMPREF1541_08679 [Cyphellophora europaea CBS 101466]ETN36402.1 hypothetical protein HMPREF1541_08679 [Cyphellophora europaea CBS 101466]
MELVIAPPNRIAAGSKLGSPLVVTFKASKLRRRPVTAEGGEGQDLSGVWAYISLMSEDKSRTLAPPRTDLLRGHPAASIHPLDSAAQRGGSSFAYAAFPDLTITAPGRYCFCINVFDMNSSDGQSTTTKLLPALHTHVFDVIEDTHFAPRQGQLKTCHALVSDRLT